MGSVLALTSEEQSLERFGGMPYANWLAGEQFQRGAGIMTIYLRTRKGSPSDPRKFLDPGGVTNKTCPACERELLHRQSICLVTIGPGDDPDEQEKCRDGRHYNAIAVAVHWACATGVVESP